MSKKIMAPQNPELPPGVERQIEDDKLVRSAITQHAAQERRPVLSDDEEADLASTGIKMCKAWPTSDNKDCPNKATTTITYSLGTVDACSDCARRYTENLEMPRDPETKKRRSRAKHSRKNDFAVHIPHQLYMEPCPCGRCSKFVVRPLFYSQDATISKSEAEEVVKRWNEHPGLWNALNQLVNAWEHVSGIRATGGYRIDVEKIEAWLKKDMKPAIDNARKALRRPIPKI